MVYSGAVCVVLCTRNREVLLYIAYTFSTTSRKETACRAEPVLAQWHYERKLLPTPRIEFQSSSFRNMYVLFILIWLFYFNYVQSTLFYFNKWYSYILHKHAPFQIILRAFQRFSSIPVVAISFSRLYCRRLKNLTVWHQIKSCFAICGCIRN